jgi:hypothetical protein
MRGLYGAMQRIQAATRGLENATKINGKWRATKDHGHIECIVTQPTFVA